MVNRWYNDIRVWTILLLVIAGIACAVLTRVDKVRPIEKKETVSIFKSGIQSVNVYRSQSPIVLPKQFIVYTSKNKHIKIYGVWDEKNGEYVPMVEISGLEF